MILSASINFFVEMVKAVKSENLAMLDEVKK